MRGVVAEFVADRICFLLTDEVEKYSKSFFLDICLFNNLVLLTSVGRDASVVETRLRRKAEHTGGRRRQGGVQNCRRSGGSRWALWCFACEKKAHARRGQG